LSGCGDNGAGGGGGGKDTTATNTPHTHTWGDWVITTPATCDAQGVETRTCTKGDTSATRAVPKLTGEACSVDPSTVVRGTFTDNRNGKEYKTVKIGTQTWMAENLDYQTDSSWCYGDNAANCAKYGRLYTWTAARKACPNGWHTPSRREWGDLAIAAGGTDTYGTGGTAGIKLKSKTDWKDKYAGKSGNGTDDYGFSALPSGIRYPVGRFDGAGNEWTSWWTSEQNGDNYGYDRHVEYLGDGVSERNSMHKLYGYSLRCVAD
jgi:uncharacterized protein (TIGR02145 family)